MTKILILFIFLIGSIPSKEETFEGSIKMKRQSFYDTSYFVFHVKQNMVRIEEYNRENKLLNILLVDLQKEKITALHPHHKVFKNIKNKSFVDVENKNYEIIKTDYRKEINGHTCYQWRVRNRSMNTEIAYWVIGNKFEFWDDLWRILNKTENNFNFFLHIPGSEGFIPLLSVERTLVRNEKSRYFITDIKKSPLNQQLFSIPTDYSLLQR